MNDLIPECTLDRLIADPPPAQAFIEPPPALTGRGDALHTGWTAKPPGDPEELSRAESYDGGAWNGEPLPFEAPASDEEPFPLCVLPPVLAQFASDLTERVQAPPALVGTAVITASAAVVQAHVDVIAPHGAIYPATEFGLVVVGSGGRKSTVFNTVFNPIIRRQTELMARTCNELSGDCVGLIGDLTSDAIIEMMYRHGLKSILAASPEAAQVLAGFAWDRRNKLRTAGLLSAAYDGAALDRARIGGAVLVRDPRLSIFWAAQPIASERVLNDDAFQNQGIAGRFLLCAPPWQPGGRFLSETCRVDQPESYSAYYAAMNRILEIPFPLDELGGLAPRRLEMSRAARAQWISTYNTFEEDIASEAEVSRAFTSRAAEHIARIACILEAFTDPQAQMITEESVNAAAALVQWYRNETLHISTTCAAMPAVMDAKCLWGWLLRNNERYVPFAKIQRYAPTVVRGPAKRARAALETLQTLNRVRPASAMNWEGALRAEVWEVRGV